MHFLHSQPLPRPQRNSGSQGSHSTTIGSTFQQVYSHICTYQKAFLWNNYHYLEFTFCRFVLDTYSYVLFLVLLLLSVVKGIGDNKNKGSTWYLYMISVWVTCYMLRDIRNIMELLAGHKTLSYFRFFYDLFTHCVFFVAIGFKVLCSQLLTP